jgi:hypothetical protein
MGNFSLPQNCKIVTLLAPAADAAGRTGDYISLKNAHKVWLVFNITNGHATATPLSVNKATAVAPTGAAGLAAVFPIWSNADIAATDTLVRQTDAASFSTAAAVKDVVVVFEIDPAILGSGFDCIAPVTGASNALNLTSCMAFIQERYQQATPPTAILD